MGKTQSRCFCLRDIHSFQRGKCDSAGGTRRRLRDDAPRPGDHRSVRRPHLRVGTPHKPIWRDVPPKTHQVATKDTV